jgi:hypothetical protein
MPNIHKKTQTNRLQLTGAPAQVALQPLRVGMPSTDTILDDKTTFTPKKGGPTYRILKTTETDSYEKTDAAVGLRQAIHGNKAPAMAAMVAAAKKKPSTGDQFGGKDRKIAKLSIPTAPTQNFADVAKLVASLPSVDSMVKLKIPTTSNSDRVSQEKRNIHVNGFLYAASREADNDFHCIVGCDPKTTPETYMTMEVSGLPPKTSPAFGALNAARTAYKQFFGTNLPGAGYHFYQPPIKVQVDGALFFDATHSKGPAPGPASLKSRMPTIFEVHPVTKIKLG